MKKALLVTAITLGSLLLIVGSCSGLLLIPSVQTWVVQKVSDRCSDYLHTDVRVGYVHYKPFDHLAIDSLFVSDLQHDTLLHVPHIRLHFHPLLLRQNRLDITCVEILDPYVSVRTLSDSTLNCQFLLDALSSDTVPDTTSLRLRINVDRLSLQQTRIRFDDYVVSPLDMDLTLPVLSADSLDVRLRQLSFRASIEHLGLEMQACAHGSLDSIAADRITLRYKNQNLFSGSVSVVHPLTMDSALVQVQCDELFMHYPMVQDILSKALHHPVQLPPVVSQLGKVHYRGSLSGGLKGLYLAGAFTTNVGALTVNGFAKSDTAFHHLFFDGAVASPHLAAGRLLRQPDVGSVTFHASGNVHLDRQDSLWTVNGSGEVDLPVLEYKGYTYRDLSFNGCYEDGEISGDVQINDSNISLSMNGVAVLNPEDLHADLTLYLRHFCPYALHLTDQNPEMTFRATTYLSAYTNGSEREWLDNFSGYIILDTLVIDNGKEDFTIQELKVLAENDLDAKQMTHRLRVQSEMLTASLVGPFHYATLPYTFSSLLRHYIPSLIGKPIPAHAPNDVDFYAYFREFDRVTRFFNISTHLLQYPTIKGFVHESSMQFGLQAYLPRVDMAQSWMDDVSLSLGNANDELSLSLSAYHHFPPYLPIAKSLGDLKLQADVVAQNDSVDLLIQCGNTATVHNQGQVHISTLFSRPNAHTSFVTHIFPSTLLLNDTTWTLHDATISYAGASQVLSISDFALRSQYQSLEASGIASPRPEDSIYIALRNFDINYLLGFIGAAQAISVQGLMTGWARAYGLMGEPLIEAHFDLPQAGLNGVSLGHLQAQAHLDRENEMMVITGEGKDSVRTMVHVDGKIIPKDHWWGLDIFCDSVDLGMVNFWTSKILSNVGGRGYGRVQVFGKEIKTWVTGRVLGRDAHTTIPAIGASIYFTDSVLLDSAAIRFPHIPIHDAQGHTGTFNGEIRHSHFQHMNFDLTADLNNMLALNLSSQPGSPFYGQVYATGKAHIYGQESETHIDVNAKTEPNSKFFLKVNGASTAATTSTFLTFTHSDTMQSHLLNLLPQSIRVRDTVRKTASSDANMLLSMQLEVHPTTEINLVMGAEDGIKGRGEGNIRLAYNQRANDFRMLGTYTLSSGIFNFTLANLIRRQFEIAEGSQVIWDGKAEEPTVDITAKYRLTASLRDLYGNSASQVNTNRNSVPVNVVLHMTDRLFNPVLNFAIELPQSDASVQSQVMSIISTDEMLMREVIYLLVFNRFYTPEYLQAASQQGLKATYSLVSSTITGQINSWLSKLTDIFTMGFNFRSDGEGESASQEYEANFSIHPVQRLIINGNFGYRYNDLSNRPFFGDLDLEYMLTEDGKFRAKAYTHTVDKYSLKQANTVQGVGLLFKYDFNWKENPKSDSIRINKKETKLIK